MDPIAQFELEKVENIKRQSVDKQLRAKSLKWLEEIGAYNYTYNFSWLGRPIIQLPQDMVAMQELIWSIKPDMIIETGIAHGGSLIFHASMLALLDYCDMRKHGSHKIADREVVGIDIDIRSHNRAKIEDHPLYDKITLIEGSSIESSTSHQVRELAKGKKKVLVCLDSNHTHDHVLEELKIYAPMVSKGSYCVVFDTLIEDLDDENFIDRPWGRGNNSKTALHAYLKMLNDNDCRGLEGEKLNFLVNQDIENKLLLTACPSGYLQRV